jgi:hypothetical protein
MSHKSFSPEGNKNSELKRVRIGLGHETLIFTSVKEFIAPSIFIYSLIFNDTSSSLF